MTDAERLEAAIKLLGEHNDRFESLGRVHHIACIVGPTRCLDHRVQDFLIDYDKRGTKAPATTQPPQKSPPGER